MRHVGAYEAKTHLPRLLEEVAAGQAITITKHGVPVAILVPFDRHDDASVRESIAGLRAFRRRHPLRGISIRELIDEGRH